MDGWPPGVWRAARGDSRIEPDGLQQLKTLSQKERDLILKVSSFSEHAWGARGVYLGSDLSHADWSAAVDRAISSFANSPFVLQRYEKPKLVETQLFDFEKNQTVPMKGRARLCPYYFVGGDGDAARPQLGGVLATICPADKKIIHGMTDAILAPCGCELVTFLGLEFEDLILVLALAALMNLLAHFVSGNAHVFGMQLNIFMEFIVPAFAAVSDRFQVWAASRVSHRPCAFILLSKGVVRT